MPIDWSDDEGAIDWCALDCLLPRGMRACSTKMTIYAYTGDVNACHLCLMQGHHTHIERHMHVCQQGYSGAAGACIEAAKRLSRSCWQNRRAAISCCQASERTGASHGTIGRRGSMRHGTLCSCWARGTHSRAPDSTRTAQLDAWRTQECSQLEWSSASTCSRGAIDTCAHAPVSFCPDWWHTATASIQSMDTQRARPDPIAGAIVPHYRQHQCWQFCSCGCSRYSEPQGVSACCTAGLA